MSNLQPMYPAVVNSVGTSLTGSILANQTKFYVQDITKIPYPPNLLVIGEDYPTAETVKLISISGDGSIVVERGFQGMARDWEAGITIARNHTAYDDDAAKSNIEVLQRANTIPKLIYTTKDGVGSFPIKPYSIYYLADNYEIQFDDDKSERRSINLLRVFETENERLTYKKPIQNYFYLVKESNELWWYGVNGWHIVSLDVLIRDSMSSPEVQINLDYTLDEALDDSIKSVKGNMYLTKDTRQMVIDMMTSYYVTKPHSKDCLRMVSDEVYTIYQTESERLAVDTDGEGFDKQFGSYVVETNKLWYWIPSQKIWKRVYQSFIFGHAIKEWAKELQLES